MTHAGNLAVRPKQHNRFDRYKHMRMGARGLERAKTEGGCKNQGEEDA
jgi:hypothetical protein